METPAIYELFFRVFAFVMGAAIGSFLNVCIYRLPRDLSINEPRRSFCPACKNPIPWQQNLPLFSWLVLRGKCANCGSRIAFRYFVVELLTAFLFLAVWIVFPWQVALVYWVFVSLLVIATFIDFEHFIIPDEITIGGTVAGVVASVALPALMARRFAAAGGFMVVRVGCVSAMLYSGWCSKGERRLSARSESDSRSRPPSAGCATGDDAEFVIGDERGLWSDHFARESDLMLMHCAEAQVDGRSFQNTTLQLRYNQLTIEQESFPLDEVDRITGVVRELQIPREAMGRGDLKFLAAIGAFLGWRAVLCSIFAGSVLAARWSASRACCLVGAPGRRRFRLDPTSPLARLSGCSLAGV